jgi:hypothetical protein
MYFCTSPENISEMFKDSTKDFNRLQIGTKAQREGNFTIAVEISTRNK